MKKITLGLALTLPTLALASAHWVNLNSNQSVQSITPKSINTFVKKTGMFKNAKHPTMKETILYSKDASTHQHYSIYRMFPQRFIGKVTKYKTIETVKQGWRFPGIAKGHEATVHGHGLSLGGIFWPKEQMIIRNHEGKIIYNNKIDIYAIKPVSGHLFPMKVGNVLKFDFQRYHSQFIDGHTNVENETGVMTYKVVKKFTHLKTSKKPIPGPIYEVEVWESTNVHPKPYLTDIYAYSKDFQWYVSDKYFTKENRLKAWYSVRTWN